jgi:signal transduction histidine kinase
LKDLVNSDLLKALGHDLRGPIGAIANWLHVFGSEKASAAAKAQALTSMGGDVSALRELTDQLSVLASLLEVTVMAPLQSLDVVPLLGAAAASSRGHATEVRLETGESSLRILADPLRLQQLVSLLASSAFTGGPGPCGLRLERRGTRAEIAVETKHPARAMSLAMVQALTRIQEGTVEQDPYEGNSRLRILFPLAP